MNFSDYKYYVQMDMLEYIEENLQSFSDNKYRAIDNMRPVVTGDDNGSYYCDAYKARKAVTPAMWEIGDELENYYGNATFLASVKDAEYLDVLIRDYAFSLLEGEIDDMIENVIYDQTPEIE